MQAQLFTFWIGIDVAKATVEAAIHPSRESATFERTRSGMRRLSDWARARCGAHAAVRAVMEATGNYSSEAIAWLLEADAALAPACVNPLHAKRFAQSIGTRNKTDRVDACVLARMGAERSPAPYEAPGPVVLELRALVRERRELVDEATRLKNRIGEGTGSRFVSRERNRILKATQAAIARIEEEMERVIASDARLAADSRRLCTIPGVGPVTAATILGELGDLRRFGSGRQLAAFAGLSPRRFESGATVRGRARLCKQGNPAIRAILYMSAVSTSRMASGMKATYDRLLAHGKAPKCALGALMRKQLILMRALVVGGKDYEEPVENNDREDAKNLA
ncbi:MAG: IS110 family transposase [Candidatus Sumerlaeia bacterium]|nr:IS110 family transposase [Candidatus Sumerlaeia bacterium]